MSLYIFRQTHTADELRHLAGKESTKVCRRMLMIANLMDGMEPSDAAGTVGLGRSSAYHWHNRYEEEGIPGLHDLPRSHPTKVDAVVAEQFKKDIVAGAELERDGVVTFRGVDAQRLLKDKYDIEMSLSGVYALLHRLRLSWLAPRPRHPKSDVKVQDEYTKLFKHNLSESRLKRHKAGESKSGLPTKRELARRTL